MARLLEARTVLRARPPRVGPATARRRLLVVALTGTPGTGKTSTARALRTLGFPVLDLNRLAKRFALGYDKPRRSWVVDERKLARHVAGRLDAYHAAAVRALRGRARPGVFVIEGHFAHDLAFADMVVVLRADPRVVEARLRKRGYARRKARENAEAEAIGVVAGECRRRRHAYELDATTRTPAQTATAVAALVRRPTEGHRIGRIDWADAVLAW